MPATEQTLNMAVFCDLENVALGVQSARYARFDIKKVLERLLLKGNIVTKKSYCDWDRYKPFKEGMHEAAFELIEIPHVRQSGKNSADIRMVVDALDLCYTKAHIDGFVIISGDSDFSPLVSKLRENNKAVIGVGVKNSSSDLLIANCDEFIFYDDLVREEERERRMKAARTRAAEKTVAERAAAAKPDVRVEVRTEARMDSRPESRPESRPDAPAESAAEPTVESQAEPQGEVSRDAKQLEAINLVIETAEAIQNERGENEKIWGSMVKQTLRRRKPGFNESYYGFRSFGQLLEAAAARGMLVLERDKTSGGYILHDFSTNGKGQEATSESSDATPAEPTETEAPVESTSPPAETASFCDADDSPACLTETPAA